MLWKGESQENFAFQLFNLSCEGEKRGDAKCDSGWSSLGGDPETVVFFPDFFIAIKNNLMKKIGGDPETVGFLFKIFYCIKE